MSNQSVSIKKSRLHFAAVIILFVAFLVMPAQAAEISGQKWNDLDGDAVKDPGEPGVPNIWIGIFPRGPIIWEPGDPEPYGATTFTDSSGNYSFTNVPGNTDKIPAYEIAEDIPFDWIQTYPGYVCPNCSLQYSHIVTVASDTIVTNLDFGNRQLTPPPPDVTVVNQSGEQNGIPTVYRPTLSDLVIQKNLSSYDEIVSVNLTMIWMMTWSGGTITKNASMAEIDATGVWEAIIPQYIPAGTAMMTFEVDVAPSGPGPEDLIEYGDIIFIDPSGTIRDACTNVPINGAIVTLYVYDSTQDLFVPCPKEMILFSAPNTQITGIDGEYAWMTASGTYKVNALMAGYQVGWSEPVIVPPPQTGVDIYLTPTGTTIYPLDIELTQVQIFPHGADKVQIQGTITLNSTSDGIDPVMDGINLRLFLPTGLPGSNQFYPTKNDIMPVYLQAISGGWSINASEKSRTGIQDLKILQTPDPAIFTFILVDTKSALMTDDYQDIIIDIYSGNDVGITDVRLRENNNKYTL